MEAGNHSITRDEYAHAFQQGDEQALAFFYHEFHPVLSLHAHRLVEDRSIAEEIAAEALVKTWKMHWKLDSYGAIRAYLYKIVHRDSLSYIRKEKKRTAMHQQSQPPQTVSDTPFDHVVRCEVYRTIHTALKDLSPANRKVIIMHYLEGKTTGQIARELNVHPSTVKTQKNRGLQALRKQLLRPILLVVYFLVKFLLPPL
ncbi:MAG: sigma-70 family RNA polymerase sigma factor [Chitinophagaceae bacterium]|nr:sigma-70 family RNA polymerase sigma factor [Chitinophagaceae bacterium]